MAINEELDFLVSRVAKVRKWLAAIAILKTAAICLLFACVYIGGYILLDHRFNFSLPGRLIAFFILLGSTVFLIYKMSRLLLIQISYTNAANFIENNYSLNQQLVAAMEYYENKSDYPYSKILAEQLILRVNKDSEAFRFDSVVEKWRGILLAAFVFLGLSVVTVYVQHNISFLATYFSRLAAPFSSVAPISATSLETITGDIVAEPESMLTLSAKISGRIPEFGQLIISPIGEDSNDQKIKLRPIEEVGAYPIFETSEFFANVGQYQYRFDAGLAQTQWKKIDIRESPKILSITAEIELPQNIHDDEIMKNYTEQIKNNNLEIIENSSVTLHIETSSMLSKIELKNPDGTTSKKELNGEQSFSHKFIAKDEGNFEFNLTDDKGLNSKNLPKLKIQLKTDNPPQFDLISPDGDYLATNVSSVPIEFIITDDFGLSSAEFIAELPQAEKISIDIPVEPDSNETSFNYIFELEQYDLEIGDSIMFYANATDIKTTISDEENTASSEIYFIEIRPYQQIWHIREGGEGQGNPAPIPEDLMTLLEYTRSIIKKTSVIEGKSKLDSEDRSNINSINEDVEYCSSLLVQLRDDPDNNFSDTQKAVLNEILDFYGKSSHDLKRFDVTSALSNEKESYRILRKFILELEMDYNPPDSGQTIPKETPDRTELKAAIETPEVEPEQVEEKLNEVHDEIEKLQVEQDKLKDELEKVLEQKKQANDEAKLQAQAEQELSNSNTNNNGNTSESSDSNSSDGNIQSSQPSQGSSGNGSDGQQGDSSQPSQGSSGNGSDSQQGDSSQPSQGSSGNGSDGKQGDSSQPSQGSSGNGSNGQQGDSSQPSQGSSGNGTGNSPGNNMEGLANNSNQFSSEQSQSQAIANAQLNMLQAKQAELQKNVSQLQNMLESISNISEGELSQLSNDAQNHLGKALEDMQEFQDKMDELEYQPQEFDKTSQEASDLMDSAADRLESANASLQNGLHGSEESQLASELMENAELLAEDADSIDSELSPLERERMEALRQRALELLQRNTTPQNSPGGSQPPSELTPGTLVVTHASGGTDKETPRQIARDFWFLAIELEKRKEQPIENEPSDSRFVEIESDFFEEAAKYNSGGEKP